MNHIQCSLAVALTVVCGLQSVEAQTTQKFTAAKHNEYGLVYSLPVTHVRIMVEAEKTVSKAGPFYKYAKKYLGIDNVVAIAPSYGMYEVCADINDVAYRKAMLTEDFDIDIQAIFEKVDQHTKVVWICSPNNPTGNAFSRNSIEAICAGFAGIVVVDEAYIDFSDKGSMVGLLYKYPNLIVLQTMSKAWGSASIRLGIAFASPQIIAIFNKVKYPYNINLLTQNYALEMLNRSSEVQTWVDVTIQQRQAMAEQLAALPIVEKIFPSDANFLLARVTDADGIYNYLCNRGIVVRNRNNVPLCKGCIRFTVGTAEENTNLINALSNYGK